MEAFDINPNYQVKLCFVSVVIAIGYVVLAIRKT